VLPETAMVIFPEPDAAKAQPDGSAPTGGVHVGTLCPASCRAASNVASRGAHGASRMTMKRM